MPFAKIGAPALGSSTGARGVDAFGSEAGVGAVATAAAGTGADGVAVDAVGCEGAVALVDGPAAAVPEVDSLLGPPLSTLLALLINF